MFRNLLIIKKHEELHKVQNFLDYLTSKQDDYRKSNALLIPRSNGVLTTFSISQSSSITSLIPPGKFPTISKKVR